VSDEPTVPEPDQADVMRALDRVRLPVSTLRDAIPHLRRPFTPEAIRFKVQSVFKQQDGTPSGCLIVAYIDQRLATERLNRVIPDKWSASFEPVAGTKLMWCRLTIDGVSRVDVGESPKGFSKDLVSDALKRAAVPFGVGVSCYALPQITINVSDARDRIKIRGKGEKRTIVLTDYGHETLRTGYARWLEAHGIDRFGPPLDHGDVVGATLDEDAPEEETGIAVGDGDGSAPGWGDMSPELVEEVEQTFELLVEKGIAPPWEMVQMQLHGQPESAVRLWIETARAET
jgi:hypothetical protein